MHTSYSYVDDQGDCINCLLPANIDPILVKYESHIKSFGFETFPLIDLMYNPDGRWNVMQVLDESGLFNIWDTDIRGFSPGHIFDDVWDTKYREKGTGLTLIEQLYTARGSQGAGVHYKLV